MPTGNTEWQYFPCNTWNDGEKKLLLLGGVEKSIRKNCWRPRFGSGFRLCVLWSPKSLRVWGTNRNWGHSRGGNGKLITLFLWIMGRRRKSTDFPYTTHHSRRWNTKCHSELPHENKQIRPKDRAEMVSKRQNVATIKVRLIGLEWMVARRSNNLDFENVWTGVLAFMVEEIF